MSPSLPARVTADGVAAAFRTIARRRHARALHPTGPLLRATAELDVVEGVPALARPRAVAALVRLSRALGTPPPLPDARGLAVRLLDLHGPGRHQDLLLTSCGRPPLHVLLAPAGDPERCWYTSLLPYRVGRARRLLVAHGEGGGRFVLGHAGLGARWERLGVLRLGEPLEPSPGEGVRFDPILMSSPQLHQAAGPLNLVRERAYQGSREGRVAGRLD